MALTKTVTKLWPTKDTRNIFHPGINLKLFEGEEEVRNKDFDRDFVPGRDDIGQITADIIKEAQAYIDHYKEERDMYVTQAYDTAVGTIDSGLSV
jgi:hypothetical protein